jgi:hypothetical protein
MAPIPPEGNAVSPMENILNPNSNIRLETPRLGSKKTPPIKGLKKQSIIFSEKPRFLKA